MNSVCYRNRTDSFLGSSKVRIVRVSKAPKYKEKKHIKDMLYTGEKCSNYL